MNIETIIESWDVLLHPQTLNPKVFQLSSAPVRRAARAAAADLASPDSTEQPRGN